MTIAEHEKDCHEKNDLRYMGRAIFSWSMLALVLAAIGALAAYYKAEAAQSERIAVIEQTTKTTEMQFLMIMDKLDKIEKR